MSDRFLLFQLLGKPLNIFPVHPRTLADQVMGDIRLQHSLDDSG